MRGKMHLLQLDFSFVTSELGALPRIFENFRPHHLKLKKKSAEIVLPLFISHPIRVLLGASKKLRILPIIQSELGG